MHTYDLKFGSDRFPSLYDTYTFRSPEELQTGQKVWGQTAQGLQPAEVVSRDSETATKLALKAPWVPRCYSSPGEKVRQKREAGV